MTLGCPEGQKLGVGRLPRVGNWAFIGLTSVIPRRLGQLEQSHGDCRPSYCERSGHFHGRSRGRQPVGYVYYLDELCGELHSSNPLSSQSLSRPSVTGGRSSTWNYREVSNRYGPQSNTVWKVRRIPVLAVQSVAPAIEPFDQLTTSPWNCNPTPNRPSGSR